MNMWKRLCRVGMADFSNEVNHTYNYTISEGTYHNLRTVNNNDGYYCIHYSYTAR